MKEKINKFIVFISALIFLSSAILAFATVNFDLANLRNQNALFTKAYDVIKIQDAWEKIQSLNPQLSNIKIGIIDVDGVDVSHQEFKGEVINGSLVGSVDFGNTPLSARVDEGGHGTAVAGIMGANNVSFFKTLEANSPQMSGIVSGVSPNLNYTLEARKTGSAALLFDRLKAIFFQSQLFGADTINISLGEVKRSALTEEQQNSGFIGGQVGPITFFSDTEIFRLMFKSAPDTLFVVSAGNYGVNADNTTPANLGDLANVITAGATSLEDERARFNAFQESNFGNIVTIAAPGKNVYTSKLDNAYDKPVEIGDVITGGFSGTSASAPFVTGVAAILKALELEYQKYTQGLVMSPATIKQTLISSSDPINTGELDKRLGNGCYNYDSNQHTGCRLNAYRAVAWYFPPDPVENLTAEIVPHQEIQSQGLGSFGISSLAAPEQTVPKPPSLNEPPKLPGTVEGEGTHFEVTDSSYLNITLDSTKAIKLRMESVPEMVTMFVEPTSSIASTQITLQGFQPNTTYYKYEDNYHNLTTFTTNTIGSYSYTQDLSDTHIVFIQPRHSTKFIKDDVTGGDCVSIGTWDLITKTCTLGMDLTETIQIDNDNITLDGNGHTIIGSNTGTGVYLPGRTGVTIKNLNVQKFSYGIYLESSSNNTLTSNTSSNNALGIYSYSSNNNTLTGNIVSNNFSSGIYLVLSNSNTLTGNTSSNNVPNAGGILLIFSNDNTFTGNTASGNNIGIFLAYSKNNILISNIAQENSSFDIYVFASSSSDCDNNITDNTGSGGRPIKYFNSAVNLNNETLSELVLCNADGSSINNVTIDGSSTKKNNGLLLIWTDFSTITNTNSSDNAYGYLYMSSSNNTFTGNTASDNNFYGIYLESSSNNNILTSNTVSNNSYGGIYLHSSSNKNNQIYNNNFINNFLQAFVSTDNSGNVFNLAAPIGGNYYSDFDTPAEGCNNANNDSFCDSPYVFTGGQDNLPWVEPIVTTPEKIDVNLTWIIDGNKNPDFDLYRIYRSANSTVDNNDDALVTEITNPLARSYTDPNLDSGIYHYGIFVIDKAGLESEIKTVTAQP